MKPKRFVTGISTLILFSSLVVGAPQENLLGDPPVIAPFSNLDTYSINDWWNRDKNEIIDLKVPRDEVIAFALYTVSNKTLKLSAQLFPLFPKETRKIRLEIYKNNTWQEIELPFASFWPNWRGRKLNAPPISSSDITALGIMIYDGQNGPFRLEVDWIKAK